MFTADVIDAETADRMGLVNRVVEDEILKEVTCRFAEKLAGGAPIALSLLKKILNQSDRLDLQASMEVETGARSSVWIRRTTRKASPPSRKKATCFQGSMTGFVNTRHGLTRAGCGFPKSRPRSSVRICP